MTVYIYGLWDCNYNLRYIGKSKNPDVRLKQHFQEANFNKSNSHKDNWIRSLLSQGLEPKMEILEECNETNWEEVERIWIKECREIGLNLVNHTNGGEGVRGFPLSEKHKRKISESQRGKIVSEETRKRMSKAQKGKYVSQETKKKIGDFHRGKKLSPKHIEAIRNANLGNKRGVGRKASIETRKKQSESRKEYLRKHGSPNKGKSLSEEHKEKLRLAFLGEKNHFYGKHHTEKTKKKLSLIHKMSWAKKKNEINKLKQLQQEYFDLCSHYYERYL